MADGKKSFNNIFNDTIDMDWTFDDRFDRCFLVPEEVNRLENNLFILRRNKAITQDERSVIKSIITLGKNRYKEFQIKLINQPRRDAQKFIGKKNVRFFIFKRDGYKCLKCGKDYSLSVDHIVPVSKGGLNIISNLQTLCTSCNSSKRDKIADYRTGGTDE